MVRLPFHLSSYQIILLVLHFFFGFNFSHSKNQLLLKSHRIGIYDGSSHLLAIQKTDLSIQIVVICTPHSRSQRCIVPVQHSIFFLFFCLFSFLFEQFLFWPLWHHNCQWNKMNHTYPYAHTRADKRTIAINWYSIGKIWKPACDASIAHVYWHMQYIPSSTKIKFINFA